jgi:NAD(P)-dependent dehydrogenase (short-subunit alcohol dehydrogenase family)
MTDAQRIALVTGANRGLGLEVCRQLARAGLRVILSSRDGLAGKAAADKLQSEGLTVIYQPLDVTRDDSVRRLGGFIEQQLERLDVLVNNAGVLLEGPVDRPTPTALETPLAMVGATMDVNVRGALRVAQMAAPLMRRNHYGRIVNLSSRLGQLNEMGPGFTAYRLSKTALNALTRVLAAELRQDNILVNSVSPGWVRTRMGGPNAPTSIAEAAADIVWAAMLPSDGPTGGFFEGRQPLPW